VSLNNLITVVIPCFNYGKFILEAVASIKSQTIKNVEIVIVDANSNDKHTESVLKKIKLSGIKVFFLKKPTLVGSARNFGISNVNTKYVCCLDPDDILEPTYIEKALYYLEIFNLDIVSTSVQLFGLKSEKWSVIKNPTLDHILKANQVATCAIFTKKIWNQVNGYFDYGKGAMHVAEDWDFWIRCLANGARVRNINEEYLLRYRKHSSSSLSQEEGVPGYMEQLARIIERNKDILNSKSIKDSSLINSIEYSLPITNLVSYDLIDNPQKTIFFVLPYLIAGGAEHLILKIVQVLASLNFGNIVIISTDKFDDAYGSCKEKFEKYTPYVYRLDKFLEAHESVKFLDYLFCRYKPNITINCGSCLFYNQLHKYRQMHTKFFDFLFNDVAHVENHKKNKNLFYGVFSESSKMTNFYTSIGWTDSQIHHFRYGNLNQSKSNHFNLRSFLNIPNDSLIVGFSGRFSEEKAPDKFIALAKHLKNYNISFIMTGSGIMLQEIKESIFRENLSRVFIQGYVENSLDYICNYDILILPSRLDGRPLVISEANSFGVPVIASDVGSISEEIIDGENGFVLKKDFIGECSTHLIEFANNKNLLVKLKEKTRRFHESSDKILSHSNQTFYNFLLTL
jgi:glycosyltransferase involved in cell wall biosynthesis